MLLRFDPEADAAYLSLVDEPAPGCVARSIFVAPTAHGAELLVDVDADGRLVGVEILGASRGLPPAVLAQAVPYE